MAHALEVVSSVCKVIINVTGSVRRKCIDSLMILFSHVIQTYIPHFPGGGGVVVEKNTNLHVFRLQIYEITPY